MAFIVLLSSKQDFTFTVTDDLFNAFPFEDYELHAERDNDSGSTTFSLRCVNDKTH